jgi:hypothetical protein
LTQFQPFAHAKQGAFFLPPAMFISPDLTGNRVFEGEHTMKVASRRALCLTLACGIVCIFFAPNGSAQMRTQTTTKSGNPARKVNVDRAEVVLVSGRDLVLKMEDGSAIYAKQNVGTTSAAKTFTLISMGTASRIL